MSDPKDIISEIGKITGSLIASGICTDQNFPTMRKMEGGVVDVGFSNLEDLSITLKNIPYTEAYGILSDRRSYNIKLLDGGLLQILYRFTSGELIRHRLAFFPSPNLLEYQNNSEIYEDDELYADVIAKNIVTTPIRFDFDRLAFVEDVHPMSHLTIGQYTNCRIPVSAPLTPFYFVSFILRAFYNTPFRNHCSEIQSVVKRFPKTIVGREIETLYVYACGAD